MFLWFIVFNLNKKIYENKKDFLFEVILFSINIAIMVKRDKFYYSNTLISYAKL